MENYKRGFDEIINLLGDKSQQVKDSEEQLNGLYERLADKDRTIRKQEQLIKDHEVHTKNLRAKREEIDMDAGNKTTVIQNQLEIIESQKQTIKSKVAFINEQGIAIKKYCDEIAKLKKKK